MPIFNPSNTRQSYNPLMPMPRAMGNAYARRPQQPLNGSRSGSAGQYTSNVTGAQTAGSAAGASAGISKLIPQNPSLSKNLGLQLGQQAPAQSRNPNMGLGSLFATEPRNIPGVLAGSDYSGTQALAQTAVPHSADLRLDALRQKIAGGNQPNPSISEAQSNVYGGGIAQQMQADRATAQHDRNMAALQPSAGSQYANELWNNPGLAASNVNAAQGPQYDDMRRRFGALAAMRQQSNVTENPDSNLQDMEYRQQLFQSADPGNGYNQKDRDGNSLGEVRMVTLPNGRRLAIREDGAITNRRQGLFGEEALAARMEKKAKWDARRQSPELIERNMKESERRGRLTSVARDALRKAGVETSNLDRKGVRSAIDDFLRNVNKGGGNSGPVQKLANGQYGSIPRAEAQQDKERLANPETKEDIVHADVLRSIGLDSASTFSDYSMGLADEKVFNHISSLDGEAREQFAKAITRKMKDDLIDGGNNFFGEGYDGNSENIERGLSSLNLDDPKAVMSWFDEYLHDIGIMKSGAKNIFNRDFAKRIPMSWE